MIPVTLVGYLTLFVIVGVLFLLVNLLVGWLLRPNAPNPEKVDIYECGEPTIGSSFVQFDLRFYVVALLFLIFDVEVAFFFPWAAVYGTAVQMSEPALPKTVQQVVPGQSAGETVSPELAFLYQRLGADPPATTGPRTRSVDQEVTNTARHLGGLALADILVFFTVLLVGFAYVWRKGDLDWVRAVSQERREARRQPLTAPLESETTALSA